MIKFKAWNASNSRAIVKFHNTEIGRFGHNAFIHELIRGSLVTIKLQVDGDNNSGLTMGSQFAHLLNQAKCLIWVDNRR